MSHSAKVTARMDPELKSEAENLLNDMGLNFSVWITMATKALVNERKIPFEIKASPFYSKENLSEIKRRYSDYQKQKDISSHNLIEEKN